MSEETKTSRPVYGYFTKAKQGKQYTIYFEMEKCETCGGDVQAANSTPWLVTPLNTWVDAEYLNKCFSIPMNAKYSFRKNLPAEQYYNEDTDMCVCDNCA